MYKKVVLLFVSFLLARGMEKSEKNFLLNEGKILTCADIIKAHSDLNLIPFEKAKDKIQMLSETLFLLCNQWTDVWGQEGLNFAKTLIEKGANPNYIKVDIQALEWGLQPPYKTCLVSNTQTPKGIAKGKLLEYLQNLNKTCWRFQEEAEGIKKPSVN
ncbi:MAG: hypothetical protein AMXMBFR12_03060 [Candidatus Babeliales bacterium]